MRRSTRAIALTMLGCLVVVRPGEAQSSATTAPPIMREFRGAWVASVANIDWPSKQGLSTWQQQAELIAILNTLVDLKMNAIVFQIRPAMDAFYPSRYEPWSEYLVGQQGRGPEPSYDPLAFAIEESHKRGLELHAWFNPFRARHSTAKSATARTHVTETHPDYSRVYGTHLWLDPGDRRVRDYSVKVIIDVVRRYDVDGVQIDDYFYPYKERDTATKAIIDFPDSVTYAQYVKRGGTLGRDDWRRKNVDLFVEAMYKGVHATKPWVKVGVSPFGLWRPGYPEKTCCFDAYADLYADSKLWLQEGWLDYFSPQLYRGIDDTLQHYPEMMKWWVDQNTKGRHMWIGNGAHRLNQGATMYGPSEIPNQVRATRAQPGATGNIFFSMKVLQANRQGVADSLRSGVYAQPALVPATPWLSRAKPAKPIVTMRADTVAGGMTLVFRPGVSTDKVWLWGVRTRNGDTWTTAVLPGAQRSLTLTRADSLPVPDEILVTAVSRTGNESVAAVARRPKR
jgi:uncharacterized lipoprotein YddW (UPF0748 family)